MVNLTRIYTRAGDGGKTRLADNSVTSKTDLRLEACGTVDEANCAIGLALAFKPRDDIAQVLATVQNELFDVGADMANPIGDASGQQLRIGDAAIARLEDWCDHFNAGLPAPRSFVLPGGGTVAAQLHVSRTIVRRAERAAWCADAAAEAPAINPLAIRYLNRLSDLLFILARYSNEQDGVDEPFWRPGASGVSTTTLSDPAASTD